MPRENYAATVTAWRRFLDSVDEEVAQLPEVKRQLAELEVMYGRAQELVQERAVHQAAKQMATRELQGLLETGRMTTTYLRQAVHYRLGTTSERLVQYGMQPFRGRSRRKKDREPKEK